MLSTIIVCFCISHLPLEIQCAPNAYLQAVLANLNQMANSNKDIQNIFRPSPGGYLGMGAFGLTYKGILIKDDRSEKEVAMKFTMQKYKYEAAKEYKMYSYLHAVNNEHVEQYGIPTVYYFGKWANFFLMAITLLDTSVKSIIGNVNELDGLIMFRDFVKSSKKIHGCGIRNDDIKPDNIMFRRNSAFIIDYNLANKLSRSSNCGTLRYLPISAHLNGPRLPKDDWESFLYSMCRVFKVKLNWFNRTLINKLLSENEQREFISSSKQNITDTMIKIGKIPYKRLKRVFLEFSRHVLTTDKPIPPYDVLYGLINNEIGSLSSHQPALVSFIKDADREQAILESSTICNISSIDGPSGMHSPNYPNVNYGLFAEIYGRSQNLSELYNMEDLSDE